MDNIACIIFQSLDKWPTTLLKMKSWVVKITIQKRHLLPQNISSYFCLLLSCPVSQHLDTRIAVNISFHQAPLETDLSNLSEYTR